MFWRGFLALTLVASSSAIVRFHCSQLVRERLDPLIEPGANPSAHVHQIVGGVSGNHSKTIHQDLLNFNVYRTPSTRPWNPERTCPAKALAQRARSQTTSVSLTPTTAKSYGTKSPSELLDRRLVFSRAQRNVQARSKYREQPVRKGERRVDDLLHAGCHLRRTAKVERDCFQAGET